MYIVMCAKVTKLLFNTSNEYSSARNVQQATDAPVKECLSQRAVLMDNTQIRPNRQAVVHVKQGASVQIVIDQYLVRLATSVNMASQTAQPVVKESTAQLGHLFV